MVYVPIPTAFRASESNLQRLYYALDAMGKEKELRSKVFASIHDDHSLPYNADPDAIASWAEKNGLEPQAVRRHVQLVLGPVEASAARTSSPPRTA